MRLIHFNIHFNFNIHSRFKKSDYRLSVKLRLKIFFSVNELASLSQVLASRMLIIFA